MASQPPTFEDVMEHELRAIENHEEFFSNYSPEDHRKIAAFWAGLAEEAGDLCRQSNCFLFALSHMEVARRIELAEPDMFEDFRRAALEAGENLMFIGKPRYRPLAGGASWRSTR